MINKVILLGNVGHSPTIPSTNKVKVANFTLATTSGYKDKAVTEWHNIVCFDKNADIVEQYVNSGSQLYLEGYIKTEKYVGKDGVEKSKTKVIATLLRLLSKKEDSSSLPKSEHNSSSSRKESAETLNQPLENDLIDDEIPF